MIPIRTAAANKISATIMIPMKISSAGMSFSNSSEFSGACDLSVLGAGPEVFNGMGRASCNERLSAGLPDGSTKVYVDSD
jgi:hypothetical protein